MDLDGPEEKMLCAIVQSAITAAAAGHPFAGKFRRYSVYATRIHVSDCLVAQVVASIFQGDTGLARVVVDASPTDRKSSGTAGTE